MNIIRELPHPSEIKAEHPLSPELIAVKAQRDEEIKSIFRGESDKFLLIIGPCSADSEEPVLDYITRLRELQEKVKDKVLIIPRIYTGKPRTTGDGYKGMLHQPNPTGNPDLKSGIIAVRSLHMRALAETGFTAADEMLYPENYSYLDDLLAYIAIGARSVENQQHRNQKNTQKQADQDVGKRLPVAHFFKLPFALTFHFSSVILSNSWMLRGL